MALLNRNIPAGNKGISKIFNYKRYIVAAGVASFLSTISWKGFDENGNWVWWNNVPIENYKGVILGDVLWVGLSAGPRYDGFKYVSQWRPSALMTVATTLGNQYCGTILYTHYQKLISEFTGLEGRPVNELASSPPSKPNETQFKFSPIINMNPSPSGYSYQRSQADYYFEVSTATPTP